MAERRSLAAVILVGSWVAPAALVLAGIRLAEVSAWEATAWGAALALGQLIRAPAARADRFTLAVAVAVALPLVMRQPGGHLTDLGGVMAAVGLGLLLSWPIRLSRGEGAFGVSTYVIRRMGGILLFAFSFRYVHEALHLLGWPPFGRTSIEPVGDLLALSVGGVAWFLADTALEVLIDLGRQRSSLRYVWLLDLSDWMVALTLFATGALFGFAFPEIGVWALPVAGLPYVFSHLAFVRFYDTRSTYRQTIRALSRIPEVAGLSTEGHADRVAELALAVARDVGLKPEEVIELEYAALLHDIGRITLNEPSILKMGFTDEDVARWGSEIVGEAPYLGDVAVLVREQHHPYRRPGEERDPHLPMACKIIRAASAFDHATTDLGFSELEALEVLHRGAAYDFDPEVVTSLRRVIEYRRAAS